jgi:hypothetical protein
MMKEMASRDIQIVSGPNGVPTGVIVPIEEWRKIEAERAGGAEKPETPPDPHDLMARSREFFILRTIEEMVAAKGTKPLSDTHALEGLFTEDDDIDSMLEEIYRERG